MAQSTDFVARLELLMQHFQLSASALADAAGVQRSGISHLLSGRNKPGLDFILKLSDRFPDVDLYWLLKGEGTLLKANEARPSVKTETATHPEPAKHKTSDAAAVLKTERLIVLFPDGTFQRYTPE